MGTLADLKRELIGKTLKRTFRFKDEEKTQLLKVTTINSVNIILEKEQGGKSYLDIPKASLMEYDGKTLKIFYAGKRELTEEEKKAKMGEPYDKEQGEIDALTDSNVMFYRRKHYYKEIGMEWLFFGKKIQGKSIINEQGKYLIEDDSIKGDLILSYEILE